VTSEEEVNTQMNNLSKLIEKSIKIDKDSRVRNKRIIRFIRESNLDLKMALKVFSETISNSDLSEDDQKAFYAVIKSMLMD
jgi:hypothetical protein